MRIEELFDLDTIGELAGLHKGQGDDFMLSMLELFAADAHRSLVRMRVSAWMGDASTLAREAHRLKGTSGSFGAARLQVECTALERCARDGDLGSVVGLQERIEYALVVLRETREGIHSPALFRKARRCSNMDAAA